MSLKKLKKKLDIDDKFTKSVIKKEKEFTKISDTVTLIEGFNYMADILYLPKTKERYKYLLVVVDLATHEFDIEPMKTKEASEVLFAMKNIFSRDYIKKPKASIRTDNGTEFKGPVDKFLKSNHIFHSVSMPYRHQQLSMVESLNRTLGILFNGYMNAKEKKTGKVFKQWTDVLDEVRKELNKIRFVKPPYTEKTVFEHKDAPVDMSKKPKFKVGQLVHYQLTYPENALGHKQPTAQFRVGDYRWASVPKKIKETLYFSGAVPYRYLLDKMPNVSFTEKQLMRSKDKVEKFIIKKIIGKKKVKGKVFYKVWWKNLTKKEATWEPKDQLEEDGVQDYIQEFEESQQ